MRSILALSLLMRLVSLTSPIWLLPGFSFVMFLVYCIVIHVMLWHKIVHMNGFVAKSNAKKHGMVQSF